jgi:hypothetical protein
MTLHKLYIIRIKKWDSTLDSGIVNPNSVVPSPVSGITLRKCDVITW